MRALPLLILFAVLSGCEAREDGPPGGTIRGAGGRLYAKKPLEHHFGVIRHGLTAEADLSVPLPPGKTWIPVGFQRNCSCSHFVFVIRHPDGSETISMGQADPRFAIGPADELLLRITIETAEKESVDHEVVTIAGEFVAQALDSALDRYVLPVLFRFGIDAPVELRPYGHLDIGDIARSISYRQSFELASDRPVRFDEPRCFEPDPAAPEGRRRCEDLEASIEQDGDAATLSLRFKAGSGRFDGPFAMQVEIATDLPDGYTVRMPVTGRVIPDIEVSPPRIFSFRQFDLTKPASQALVITDHDSRRSADFALGSIVDRNGADLSEHFSLSIEPIDGHRRSRHLVLSYDGGVVGSHFRGQVHLARATGGETAVSIDFVGFDRK